MTDEIARLTATNTALLRLAGELIYKLEPLAKVGVAIRGGWKPGDEPLRDDDARRVRFGDLIAAANLLSSIPPDLMSKIEKARGE